MEPLSKFILKMQHFASRNTALGQFSCRLDSAGGGDTSAKSDFLATTWESGRLLFPRD
jgi:hypothetical protein